MKLTFNRKLILLLLLFALGMMVLGLLTYKNAQDKFNHSERVAHSYEVLNKSNELKSIAQDNETGSRGYIITGDSAFLEPLLYSRQFIFERLYELKRLTADNPAQQAKIDLLRQLIQERLIISDRTVESRNSRGLEVTASLVSRREGKDYMDRIRKVIYDIQQEEYKLLELRKMANSRSESAFMLTFYSLLTLVFSILLTAILMTQRNLRYRQKLEQKIKQMNKLLTKRVRDKAEEVKQREERYHFVLDNMREGAMIISNDWKYLYANKAVLESGRLPHGSFLGQEVGEGLLGTENSAIIKIFRHCMETRVPRVEEVELVYADGSKGYFKLSIQPIPEGLFILSMDIAERKKRERDREQYINELQELLFKISHEVRHPVTQLLGLANLVDYQLPPDDFHRIVLYMKQSAETLDGYTRELTEFVTSIRSNSEKHA